MRTFGALKVAAFATGLALGAPAAQAQFKPDTSALTIQSIEVDAERIKSFERSGATGKMFGKLEWLGGLVLTSPSSSFGGWSGLALDSGGKSLLAISDAGTWMTADIAFEDGRIAGLTAARIGPLKARDGKPLRKYRDRDSEGVVLVEGTLAKGSVLISFEHNNRIGRFPINKGAVGAPSSFLKMPPEIKFMRSDGMEAVTVLRGGPYKGAVVALAENAVGRNKEHFGWIWVGNEPKRFTLAGVSDYGVTDAVGLSDGSLLVLERRYRFFDGVRMRLIRVDGADLAPGATVTGEVLIEADMSKQIDNMEGLDVREQPSGELLITMMSDDNFNHLLQRTVLLEFALPAPAPNAADNQPANSKQ